MIKKENDSEIHAMKPLAKQMTVYLCYGVLRKMNDTKFGYWRVMKKE